MCPIHFASKDEYQRAVNHSRRVPMGVVFSTNELSAVLVLKSSRFSFLG